MMCGALKLIYDTRPRRGMYYKYFNGSHDGIWANIVILHICIERALLFWAIYGAASAYILGGVGRSETDTCDVGGGILRFPLGFVLRIYKL